MTTSLSDVMYNSYIGETFEEYYELLDRVARATTLEELSDSLETVSKFIVEHEILQTGDNDALAIRQTVTAHAYSNIRELVEKDRKAQTLRFVAASVGSFFIGVSLTLLLRKLGLDV